MKAFESRIGLKCSHVIVAPEKDGVISVDLTRPCDELLSREETPPSTQMLESLDNGAMIKRVERLQNAEELYRERASNDPRNKRV
jgi:hypothetical protein